MHPQGRPLFAAPFQAPSRAADLQASRGIVRRARGEREAVAIAMNERWRVTRMFGAPSLFGVDLYCSAAVPDCVKVQPS